MCHECILRSDVNLLCWSEQWLIEIRMVITIHLLNFPFFVALFVLLFYPFDISVGVGAFVIGLSQISFFFS